MSGFKSVTKRKRELAKLDKRQAKDQKRALRRAAARSDTPGLVSAAAIEPTSPQRLPSAQVAPAVGAASKPLTLAEAVERWRNTKVVKPKRR